MLTYFSLTRSDCILMIAMFSYVLCALSLCAYPVVVYLSLFYLSLFYFALFYLLFYLSLFPLCSLANLLLRLYDCTSGSILIGDTDIKDIDPEWLRTHVGIVAQVSMYLCVCVRVRLHTSVCIEGVPCKGNPLYKCCGRVLAKPARVTLQSRLGSHCKAG